LGKNGVFQGFRPLSRPWAYCSFFQYPAMECRIRHTGRWPTTLFHHLEAACGQIERNKRPGPQKTPLFDICSKLMRHTPACSRAAQILARLGQTNGAATAAPSTSAKNNLCVHFTHTRAHTRVRYPRGIKRLFGQKRRFSRFSALEPTLGLLLVFSISRHGMQDPAHGGVANNPFSSFGSSLWLD